MERFLYRLSISSHATRFVLSSSLFLVWEGKSHRVTRDADLLGFEIDIGFGDAITPALDEIEYPTLLDGRPPKLKAYPRYTVVAEKVEAMVKLGLANSRMKDFYDVWLLSKLFTFDGQLLALAFKNTFERRSTTLPLTMPTALSPAFSEDSQKLVQWNAFIRKAKSKIDVPELSVVAKEIAAFVMPVFDSLGMETTFEQAWTSGDGWKRSILATEHF